MTKYRVIHRSFVHGDKTTNEYEVQKKYKWFPIWFNWLNIDAYTTGVFNTFNEALEAINFDRYGYKKNIINIQ